MNNYNLFSLWWCCTHTVHSQHNCIFNYSWAGLWLCGLNKRFPLLLQKLEEFLFCMEDNHPEVGVTCIDIGFTGTQRNPSVDLNLNVTSVAFFDWLINTDLHEKPGWVSQTVWVSTMALIYTEEEGFAEHVFSFQHLPALNSYIYTHSHLVAKQYTAAFSC